MKGDLVLSKYSQLSHSYAAFLSLYSFRLNTPTMHLGHVVLLDSALFTDLLSIEITINTAISMNAAVFNIPLKTIPTIFIVFPYRVPHFLSPIVANATILFGIRTKTCKNPYNRNQ